MTCIEQSYSHNGHTTDAVVNFDDQEAKVTSTATVVTYRVYKPKDQTAFFRIASSKSVVPSVLDGHWNGIQKAVDAVVKYLADHGETQNAKNHRLDRDRKERNAAKANSEGR